MDALAPALVKIPFLLATPLVCYITFTAPNPPPKREEQLKYGEAPDVLEAVAASWRRWLSKVATWFIVLCEVAVILGVAFPSSPAARLLPLLVFGRKSAHAVRVTPAFLTGWVLLVSGGLVRYMCYQYMGRYFTFQLSVRENHQLVTDGPYAVVRHPAYTGTLMVVSGLLMCFTGSGAWLAECGVLDTWLGLLAALVWVATLLFAPAAMVLRVGQEDKVLREEFGSQWLEWSRRTPYKLVPGIF